MADDRHRALLRALRDIRDINFEVSGLSRADAVSQINTMASAAIENDHAMAEAQQRAATTQNGGTKHPLSYVGVTPQSGTITQAQAEELGLTLGHEKRRKDIAQLLGLNPDRITADELRIINRLLPLGKEDQMRAVMRLLGNDAPYTIQDNTTQSGEADHDAMETLLKQFETSCYIVAHAIQDNGYHDKKRKQTEAREALLAPLASRPQTEANIQAGAQYDADAQGWFNAGYAKAKAEAARVEVPAGDKLLLWQARYVLRNLDHERPGCGYGKMASGIERVADVLATHPSPASPGQGATSVVVPDELRALFNATQAPAPWGSKTPIADFEDAAVGWVKSLLATPIAPASAADRAEDGKGEARS